AALLHRAVLAAWLRKLHPGRRHAANATRDLERRGLQFVSRSASIRQAARHLCKLRPALEPMNMGAAPESGHGGVREAAAGRVVVVIPTLDEEQSIADVVRGIPRAMVSRVIVADGASGDATAARAKAAGADVIDAGRGYGRACLKATMAAEDADILVFMDGDGADDPRSIAALVEPIRSGGFDF